MDYSVLEGHTLSRKKYIEAKNKFLKNPKNFYRRREKIIEGFKNGIFPFSYDEEEEEQEFRDKKEENKIRNESGLIDYEKLERLTDLRNRDIKNELVRKHVLAQDLGALLEKLKKSKNNEERNKIQVGLVNTGFNRRNWRCEWTRKRNWKLKRNSIFFQNILEFNIQQQGQELKILTPSQILSRLPISLAQLKAGNNSEKLKNEIRQLLYSLYGLKKITKNIYKSLVDII